MALSLFPPDDLLWRGQLLKYGYARCTNPSCRLCFLSLAGVGSHHKKCLGWIREGDFITCQQCGERFRQFRSCQTHQMFMHHKIKTTTEIHDKNEASKQKIDVKKSPEDSSPPPKLFSDPPQTNVPIVSSRDRGRAPEQSLVHILGPVSAPRSMVSPKMLRISDGRIMVITSPQPLTRPLQQKRSVMGSDVCPESTRRKVMANMEGRKVVLEGKVKIEVKKETDLQGLEGIIKHENEENKRSEVFGLEQDNGEIMYAEETSQPGLFQEVRLCENGNTVRTQTQPCLPSSSTHHKPSSTHSISSLNRVPIVVPPGVTLPVSAKRIFPPLGGTHNLSHSQPSSSTPVDESSSSDLNLNATVKSEEREIYSEDVKREIIDPEYLPKIKTECIDEFEDNVDDNSLSNKVFVPDLPKEEIVSRIKIEEMEFPDENPKDLSNSHCGYTESNIETVWLPSGSPDTLVVVSCKTTSSDALLDPD